MVRWYIKRTHQDGYIVYYAGADTWTKEYSKRYFWYRREPKGHPVFLFYSGCEIVAEKY